MLCLGGTESSMAIVYLLKRKGKAGEDACKASRAKTWARRAAKSASTQRSWFVEGYSG